MTRPTSATSLLRSADKVVVLGAGGHARSLVDVVERLGAEVIAYATETGVPPVWSSGAPAFHDAGLRDLAAGTSCLVGVGDNAARQRLHELLLSGGAGLPAVVARTASVSRTAELAAGCVVLEHAHVGPGARLGAGSVVNTGATVEHDAVIGAFTHVAPRAILLGGARIGARTLVGAGAVVLPRLTVGELVVVGAGATVVHDIAAGERVTGTPARPRRSTEAT